MAIHFYDCGRRMDLPPEWTEAFEVYKKRTEDPQFAQYVQQKKNVAKLELQYQKIEHLDLRPLVGDFMGDFLLNAPAAPLPTTAPAKNVKKHKKATE